MSSINGYELIGELSSQNAGFCRWGFCKKDGREYFIKEFLTPVYPADNPDISAEVISRKRKLCDDFFETKLEYYKAIGRCKTGNNIIINRFFRSGTKYYIVTDRVYSDGTDPAFIAKLSDKKKETLLRSILFSFSKLHNEGIVHADVKPDNILLKKTCDGFYTAKIIDFDAGFFVHNPPSDIQGDFVYLSPEAFLKMNEEEVKLTEKIDIFALGILFHQYWTGVLPRIGSAYKYIFESVIDGSELKLNDFIPDFWKTMFRRMLSADPRLRPSAGDILAEICAREEGAKALYGFSDTRIKSRIKMSSSFYIPTDLD